MEKIIVIRELYEEPYLTQLHFRIRSNFASGFFSIYCNVSDMKLIADALKVFPRSKNDEFAYILATDESNYDYKMRVYTIDTTGHCAIQFDYNNMDKEPDELLFRFSIKTETAGINRLGLLFERFHKLRHLEFHWTPNDDEIFEEYQYNHNDYLE